MEEKFTLKIKTTYKDMVYFYFYNSYYKMKGVLNMVISAGCLALYLSGYISDIMWLQIVLIFGTLLFPVIYPVLLLIRSYISVYGTKKSKEPMQYSFSHDGINLSQNDNTLDIEWKDLFFARETKSSIYLYISPMSAFIFPKNQIYGYDANIKNLLKKHMEEKRCQLV